MVRITNSYILYKLQDSVSKSAAAMLLVTEQNKHCTQSETIKIVKKHKKLEVLCFAHMELHILYILYCRQCFCFTHSSIKHG